MKTFLRYFLQGLLYLTPLAGTVWFLYAVFGFLNDLVPTPYPGLGIVLSILGIVLVGFVGPFLLRYPLFNMVDALFERLPFIKLVYTSIKDVMKSFTGQKRGFNHPVLLQLNPQAEVYRLGFVTDSDWNMLQAHAGEEEETSLVAVYVPHSFAISGQIFIVAKATLRPVKGSGTDTMKYILAGGITHR